MLFEMPVVFHSQGIPLVGRIFRDRAGLDTRQPAVIAMGSWLTVKEQMATTYARRLAEAGYTALVFDFSGFGESRGEPVRTEIPARKVHDIEAAVEFLRTLAFVDPERIGCVSICASAQYALRALAQGIPIRSFASVAGWYHDPASVAPFYGGAEGTLRRLDRGREAMARYARTGEVTMVPAYRDGDERAGMHFRLDYYALPERGAVPEWRNEMAEMTWFYWLTFDGLSAADRVTTPALFVHGDGCVFPDHVRSIHARVRGPKHLVWQEGSQIDFYDQPRQVDVAVNAVTRWFEGTLGAVTPTPGPEAVK
jgi:fermentation-respiration switch protein FrsA (DUF1100 family)